MNVTSGSPPPIPFLLHFMRGRGLFHSWDVGSGKNLNPVGSPKGNRGSSDTRVYNKIRCKNGFTNEQRL